MAGVARLQPPGGRRDWLWPSLVLVAGLLLSAAAARWQSTVNEQRAAAALQAEAEVLADSVAGRLRQYEYGLRGARGAVLTAGIDALDRRQFQVYSASREVDREFPGARGFGFIRRVGAAQQGGFETMAARDGWPGFAVRQFAPHEGDRYVIQYIEPVERNREAVGLDVGSEPARREAAEVAARSGEATITRPITLVQAPGKAQQGFLVMLPVYRPGMPLGSEAERMAACAGWTYTVLLIEEVLQGIEPAGRALLLTLDDMQAEAGRFYVQARQGAAAALTPAVVQRRVFGRSWRLGVQAQPAFVAGLHPLAPGELFGTGSVVAVLAAALLAAFQQGWRSRHQVRREQEQLAALVAHSSDAILTESLDGRLTGFNRAAERLLGYRADEVLGRESAPLLLPPERRSMADEVREQLRRGETVENFEDELLHKDGSRVPASIAVSPILDIDGRFTGLGVTLRDISARSAAERQRLAFTTALEQQVAERTEQLNAARRDLQAVLDAVPSMIGYWDRDLRNRFANHAYRKWFGAEPGAMSGRHLRELLGEALFEKNRPFVEAVLRGEPQTFERAIPLPDTGGQRHSLAHYLPDIVDGAVQGFYVLVHDISELKSAQRRLADSEDLLWRVGRMAGVGGWAYDLRSHALTWNSTMRRILEVSDEHEPQLETALQHYPQEVRPTVVRAMQAACDTGTPFDIEVPFDTYAGRRIWVHAVGEGVRDPADPQGPPVRVVGAFQDVTQRHAADEALRAATRVAQAANAAKSAFLANMSHEIRTPLNAMIGLTYLLEHGRLEPEQRRFVGKIQIASRSLLAVVNDVLDLAKIESGEARVDVAPFDLHELIDGMVALHGDQAQSKGLAFRLSQPEGLPQRVLGDAGRLRQVLSNLLANAVKFTERGSVALVLRLVARNEAGLTLRFEVHDTGIGIAPEAQDSVFLPFAQADSSTTRRFGGTGLGLSIVRELSALMGGEVQIDSTPGQGSIFRVTLQLGAVADDTAACMPSRVALRLLVIDDDPLQAASLVAQAHALGWRAESVASVDAAVQVLRRQSEGHTLPDRLPDALLVDWQLPGGDGLQALAALASAIGRERLPPAVLVSSADAAMLRALPEDPQVDSRLALPVDASSLFNAVNRAVARRSGDPEKALRATRLEGAGALWLPGVRVLVVDDSEINCEVAARILTREGALVTACESAADALERLRETPQAFDLVLMDVQMPGMDGHEATRRIRDELGLARLPVLALTAGALLAERQRALDAGMDDFVSKPLDPDGLIRGVRRHVERVRGKPLPVRLRDLRLPETGRVPWPEIEGIDGADAALRLGQDLALFRSLLQRLFREFADLMVEPPVVPGKESECAALAARAHKLRGSAGMLGARAVQRQAAELEARLRRPAPAGGAGSPPAELLAAVARSMRLLQQASAPVLAQPLPQADAPAAEPLTAAARDDLLSRLRAQDLSAPARFEALAAGLRAMLGAARFDGAREAIENLHFAQALALLEEKESA